MSSRQPAKSEAYYIFFSLFIWILNIKNYKAIMSFERVWVGKIYRLRSMRILRHLSPPSGTAYPGFWFQGREGEPSRVRHSSFRAWWYELSLSGQSGASPIRSSGWYRRPPMRHPPTGLAPPSRGVKVLATSSWNGSHGQQVFSPISDPTCPPRG